MAGGIRLGLVLVLKRDTETFMDRGCLLDAEFTQGTYLSGQVEAHSSLVPVHDTWIA